MLNFKKYTDGKNSKQNKPFFKNEFASNPFNIVTNKTYVWPERPLIFKNIKK